MKEFGGYFQLELKIGEEYHANTIALNTGRNALELILLVKRYDKIYIPYYTCDVILEPLNKLQVKYEYYHINSEFEPEFDYSKIGDNEGFLYTNYYGLKDDFISLISIYCSNLIIDNTQAFFSKPLMKVPTFYSCRKFFGVPDGAYLYLDGVSEEDFRFDVSEGRFNHLLKRVEFGATNGYEDFKQNEYNLIGQPILRMSVLTKSLLCSIDYEYVRKKRIENFEFMHENLSFYNEYDVQYKKGIFPMFYPFLLKNKNLKKILADNRVYIPTFWANVLSFNEINKFETSLVEDFIFLPIDQRYSTTELNEIVQIILQ